MRRVVPPLPTPQKPAHNTGHLHWFVQVATPLGIWYLAAFRFFFAAAQHQVAQYFSVNVIELYPQLFLYSRLAFVTKAPLFIKSEGHGPTSHTPPDTHFFQYLVIGHVDVVPWNMCFPPVPSKHCVGGGGQDVAALEQLLRQAMSYALGGGMLHSIRICGIDMGPTSDARRCGSRWLGCEVPRVCV